MSQVNQKLERLKSQMTEQQRRDMAELLSNELRRREGATGERSSATKGIKSSRISGSLNKDQIGELYSEVNDAVKVIRQRKLEEKISKARGERAKNQRNFNFSMPKISLPKFEAASEGLTSGGSGNILMYGIVSLGLLKIVFTSSALISGSPLVNSEFSAQQLAVPGVSAGTSGPETNANVDGQQAKGGEQSAAWSPAEAQLLTQLDSRRVELERRAADVEQKDHAVKEQAKVLNDRIAELKTLTDKLSQYRQEKDQQRESRLSQLASVYGSMEPAEAAGLIGNLDDDIALSLLQRMPGKRMGQILGLMSKERAIALTRILSDTKTAN